jgi:hypothetical protein
MNSVIELAGYRRAREAKRAPKPPGKSHDENLIEFLGELLELGRLYSDWDRQFALSISTDPRYHVAGAHITARQRDQCWRIVGRAITTGMYGAPAARLGR